MPRWTFHYDGTLSVSVDAETEEEARAIAGDIADDAEKMMDAALAHLTAVEVTFGDVYMIGDKTTGEEVLC